MSEQQPVMVRVSQAKAIFGVHRSTLYRWDKAGHIKIYPRGNMSFVDPVQVKNYIKLGDALGDTNP